MLWCNLDDVLMKSYSDDDNDDTIDDDHDDNDDNNSDDNHMSMDCLLLMYSQSFDVWPVENMFVCM